MGCNAVSWAPYDAVGSAAADGGPALKRLVTGGCDNAVRFWTFDEARGEWAVEPVAPGAEAVHKDWVRDVAWAPSTGLPHNLVASCSEDKTVSIWTQSAPGAPWAAEPLATFESPVWRVSWSVTGLVLAVSSGDHKVTLWKQGVDGKWEEIGAGAEPGPAQVPPVAQY